MFPVEGGQILRPGLDGCGDDDRVFGIDIFLGRPDLFPGRVRHQFKWNLKHQFFQQGNQFRSLSTQVPSDLRQNILAEDQLDCAL